MGTVNAFLDTSTVNTILDIDVEKLGHRYHDEDRSYLKEIMKCVEKGTVRLTVNPSVRQEIENTSDPERRERLSALFNQFQFTTHNKTIFPVEFTAEFVTGEEKKRLKELRTRIRGFGKDEKVFLDASSSPEVAVLLTTDRTHLADKGLDSAEILVFTPKQLFEYLHNEV